MPETLHRIDCLDCVAIGRFSCFESVEKMQAVRSEVLVTSQFLIAVGFRNISDLTDCVVGKSQCGVRVFPFGKPIQSAQNASDRIVCA